MCALLLDCGAADLCVSAWAQAAGAECKSRGPELEGEGFILYPRVKGIFTCDFGSKRHLAHPSEALNSRGHGVHIQQLRGGVPDPDPFHLWA